MIVDVFNYPGYKVNLETGEIFGLKGQLLKPCKTDNGYYTVTINNKRRKVHRLVLMSSTNCNGNGLQVNHINGNKSDNRACNLEWCTAKENTKHAEKNNLRTHINTVTRKDRQLSDEDVVLIKRLIKDGYLYLNDIRPFCSRATAKNIYAIKHNLSYKLIKDNTEIN